MQVILYFLWIGYFQYWFLKSSGLQYKPWVLPFNISLKAELSKLVVTLLGHSLGLQSLIKSLSLKCNLTREPGGACNSSC